MLKVIYCCLLATYLFISYLFNLSEEFYDYNIIGLYAGEQNPVFLVSE